MSLNPDFPYRLDLEIAGISMSLYSARKWEDEKAFASFEQRIEHPDYTVLFRQTEELPAVSDVVIHEDECYRVHPDGKGGYLRSFFDAPRDTAPYAVAEYDHSGGIIQIEYLPKGAHCFSEIHNSFFHLGFESILVHRGRLCLHASCVDTPLGGLLFSGPSGIGKSTQANLWQQHRGAVQINGDRPILCRADGAWLAWGSPYAGSSKCHLNKSCPVSAVIMLCQSETCSLQRLSPPEAFRAIWSGLTIHSWDRTFVEKAFDLTMELISTVPVFRFSCTPDAVAVEYLERELRKECCL